MKPRILIVDDEEDMTFLLKRTLEPELDCRVATAPSGEAALSLLAEERFDLVLTDIKMPGMDGLTLLSLIRKENPDLTVMMMTGHGTIEIAVEAMKLGAWDFVTKPFDHDALTHQIGKALERSSLIRENARLQRQVGTHNVFQEIVGKSAKMERVFETIRMVAAADVTVLITGESGTGKDLTGRAIHALSDRSKGPFVAVNCPTIPEQILESELFGYKKGAFTHATHNKIGLFQEAHTGTIFLDEIGDISPTIQTKLLRVLQEKRVKPLGDTRSIPVDVRIIASTNQDLEARIKSGEFREDFFYRLNVLPITLPPLRERARDIPLIASHLAVKHCKKLGRPQKTISPELLTALMARRWKGNVRELENVIIRGILQARGDAIEPADAGLTEAPDPAVRPAASGELTALPYKEAKESTLQQFNHRYIETLLAQNDGNVSQTARQCGLERQALQQIMRRYDIKADRFRQKGETS